ncbi:MAG: phenylalanine--tRNA ligase subunit alpha [Bacteroidetes bacterium]|nr:phenylalanine--tRNA ligase subunit alpha [Bacteroidota bacterium]
MKEKIEEVLKQAKQFKIASKEDVEQFRLKFLTRKSDINELFARLKEVPTEEKRNVGQLLNQLRSDLEKIFDDAKLKFDANEEDFNYDLSLPSFNFSTTGIHPLSVVKTELISIFLKMGFDVSEGPEIEDDWHNFSALNFPENHPARDMQDTFFIENEISLRTHTSSVQVRVMENKMPPIRTISPGRVYRNEAISSRSNCFFHQIEGLYIDEKVSFADLKQTLFLFVQEFFGEGTRVRFRPSYFPFTEPSAEMDIYLGTESDADKRLTKGTGWLEILGCGMVDTAVLKNCGIDSDKYSGFAFGMGVERIAMFKYGVKDLRTFFENDTRFLEQFYAV